MNLILTISGSISRFLVILVPVLSFSVSVVARPLSDVRQFIDECKHHGRFTVTNSPRILDYKSVTNGASEEVVCVYATRCVATKFNIDERTAYFCNFNKTLGCEDFDTCVREMPSRQINLRTASGPALSSGGQCKDPLGYRFVRGASKEVGKIAPPICVQSPICQNGKHSDEVVACHSTGKTHPKEIGGKTYQLPICPSTDECISNAISLPTPDNYKTQLAAQRLNVENSTLPRSTSNSSSGVSSVAFPVHASDKKELDATQELVSKDPKENK